MRNMSKGMTLIEVMIAAVTLLIVVVMLLGTFTVCLNYIVRAKELTLANDDLKDVLEKIRSMGFANITTVFPNGVAINPNLVGGFLLHDETIIVNYPDGTDADPLKIEATVSWTSKGGTTRSQTFSTIRTRML